MSTTISTPDSETRGIHLIMWTKITWFVLDVIKASLLKIIGLFFSTEIWQKGESTLPAHVPSCSERAQPLSNKGIKLRYEEKRQFSGPRSKKISIESVLFTINTTERRKHQLVCFFRLLILPSLDHLTSRKPPSCIIQTVCQHPKTDIGCILYVNISV